MLPNTEPDADRAWRPKGGGWTSRWVRPWHDSRVSLFQFPSLRLSTVDCQLLTALMGKGRFLNQKLGKRTSRKFDLLKSQLAGRRASQHSPFPESRLPKKGVSREGKPRS